MQELSILTARALATKSKFTAVADNIANANTDGYRRKDYEFKEVISRPAGHATASYVADRAIVLDLTAGVMTETGNPFNAAIGGDGFFAIQVGDDIQYTRRGHFVLGNDGTLQTPEGYPVLDGAFGPIQFPADVREVVIAKDGTIATEAGQLGRLGVFTFEEDDVDNLTRAGNVAFLAPEGTTPTLLESPQVLQGKVEASNVNPVLEAVTMQDASRKYQTSLRLLQSTEDLESRAIRTLGGSQ